MVAEGRVLNGRYRLKERIAAGAMGTVFEAEDERLDRMVAVKLLKDDLAEDPRFIERFRREARSAAALSHRNVAGVFDYGEDEECKYIVMELAGGSDLAQVLREEGALPHERAAKIGGQIAAALAHAHSLGVVHRDIKPANVLVGPGDSVKVTDFGIARATGDSTLTAIGSVLGTAQYLSPEQASGGDVGAPSDIYSLGIVLYEMLTGAVPFTGDSAISVAMRHMNENVPAPSTLQPEVPADLDEVVLRATRRDPAERFMDASQMSAALFGAGPAQDTSPIDVAPAGARTALLERGGPHTAVLPHSSAGLVAEISPVRKRQALLLIGGLAAVAVLLALFRGASGGEEEPASRRASQTPAKEAGGAVEETETTAWTIPSGLYGADAAAFIEAAEAKGITVEPVLVASSELEPGFIVSISPGEGSEVEEGDTITLQISAPSEGSDDDDDDDDDGDDGPGESEGKGKGKPHEDKKDKEDDD